MKAEHGGLRQWLRHHRRHLVDHVVQASDRVVPREDRIDHALNQPVPQISSMTQTMIHGSSDATFRRGSAFRSCGVAGGMVAANSSLRAQRRRQPQLLRLPDLEEADQAGHRDQRGADIDDPGIDEVGDQELRDREGDAADQDRRPDLQHAAEAGEDPDQPERHDQREERQLPADHRAEQVRIEAGHAREAGDRRAERAVGDRRGIGDQRQPRRGQRREAETDQDRARHRDRRAEARGALEEGAEGKRDQQQLQPPVGGDAADRLLQRLESALLHGQPVEENNVEDDPADREEAGHGAKHRRRAATSPAGMVKTKIAIKIRHHQRDHCGNMRLHLARSDQDEQRDDR